MMSIGCHSSLMPRARGDVVLGGRPIGFSWLGMLSRSRLLAAILSTKRHVSRAISTRDNCSVFFFPRAVELHVNANGSGGYAHRLSRRGTFGTITALWTSTTGEANSSISPVSGEVVFTEGQRLTVSAPDDGVSGRGWVLARTWCYPHTHIHTTYKTAKLVCTSSVAGMVVLT